MDMMGIIGWVLFLATMTALAYLISRKKISKEDFVDMLNAFLATEAVKNLEDKAWKEIKKAVKSKLEGTAAWDIFKEWFDEDDSTNTKKTEVKVDKPKKDKTKTDDDNKKKEEKTVELKDEDEEGKKDEEE